MHGRMNNCKVWLNGAMPEQTNIGRQSWHMAIFPQKLRWRISFEQSTNLSDGSWTDRCLTPSPWTLGMMMFLSLLFRNMRRLNARRLNVRGLQQVNHLEANLKNPLTFLVTLFLLPFVRIQQILLMEYLRPPRKLLRSRLDLPIHCSVLTSLGAVS